MNTKPTYQQLKNENEYLRQQLNDNKGNMKPNKLIPG